MGQSLGTGIATALAARLEAQGPFVRDKPARTRTLEGERQLMYLPLTEKKIRALILIAPFSSISTLLETYKLGERELSCTA